MQDFCKKWVVARTNGIVAPELIVQWRRNVNEEHQNSSSIE